MQTTQVITELECEKCHTTQPISEFQKDPTLTLGYRTECRTCRKQRVKALQQRWAQERVQGLHLINHKTCRFCKQKKPVQDFCEDKNHKDGYHHICKPCQQKKQQQMRKQWKQHRTLTTQEITEKTCNTCGKTRPISHYRSNNGIKDGYDNICRPCKLKEAKKQREHWRQQHQHQPHPKHKTCYRCHQTLPANYFYTMESTRDCLSFYCKTCSQEKLQETHEHWRKERIGRTIIPTTLTCIHCHRTLPIKNFSKNKNYRDGYHHVCKTCGKIQSLEKITQWEHKRQQTIPLTEKECSTCHQTHPIEEYVKNKRRKDGYASECKTCANNRHHRYIIKWKHERKQKQANEQFELFPRFEKQCKTCNKVLPLTQFYKKRRSKDGHSSHCKTCDLQKTKESYQRRVKKPKTIPHQKQCRNCKKTFPASHFTRSSISPDGLNRLCVDCKRQHQREYLRRPGVAERLYAKQKAYYQTPKGKQKQRTWARKYAKRPEVKAKRRAYHKKYAQRPEVKAHRKQYLKKYYEKKKPVP